MYLNPTEKQFFDFQSLCSEIEDRLPIIIIPDL